MARGRLYNNPKFKTKNIVTKNWINFVIYVNFIKEFYLKDKIMKIGFDNDKYLKMQLSILRRELPSLTISYILSLAESCSMIIMLQGFFQDLSRIQSFRCFYS